MIEGNKMKKCSQNLNKNNVTGIYIQQRIYLFIWSAITFILCGGALMISGILSHIFLVTVLGGVLMIGGFCLYNE